MTVVDIIILAFLSGVVVGVVWMAVTENLDKVEKMRKEREGETK